MIQGNIATALTNALDPTVITIWTAMLDTYYLDPSKPNPFREPTPSKLLPPVPFARAESRVRRHS